MCYVDVVIVSRWKKTTFTFLANKEEEEVEGGKHMQQQRCHLSFKPLIANDFLTACTPRTTAVSAQHATHKKPSYGENVLKEVEQKMKGLEGQAEEEQAHSTAFS